MARAPRRKRSFHQELVLNRWMLGFFQGGSLEALKERLGQDRHEGIDDDGQTKFFHELTRSLFNMNRISEADLRRYDLNIVNHWQAITHRRNAVDGHVFTLKYFQYLSLLFTEIYLDWYFNRPQDLLDGLNEQMAEYRKEDGAEPFRDYTVDDLNKLAFWNATGSGKTLLLHVNIHQYLHYFQSGNGKSYPDKIILLTPNEGLSRQHLQELALSGFSFTRLFDKNRSPDFPGTIEVIDINKLGDEMGDKTVAVEAFEGNNLVLVDEGHRGAGSAGGAWMARREALVSKGFAFEYSATFGQAVNKGMTIEKAEEAILKSKAKRWFDTGDLRKLSEDDIAKLALNSADKRRAKTDAVKEAYAKAVLFDYSYKFFYADGYGKESLILNLDEKDDEEQLAKYFTACLLAFYQQLYLWDTQGEKIADFNIAKPLWVFVGNKVADDDSDILAVVRFLGDFLNEQERSTRWIDELVNDRAQLLDPKGNNIFARRFVPLSTMDAATIFSDILRRLFNAGSRQRLKLVNLKGSVGELALQVGTEEPFGLINIGDDSGFFKTADNEDEPYDAVSDDFGSGLFETLNDKGSKLNILVGSRKFTEGWSSWRVSTMGLLNMGRGEGTQIIQLFGRGVRLKGRGMSLKRSTPAERQQLAKGAHLETLETLNIFGVRANYMATFKDYLREEGITPSDEVIELDFPTKANLPSGKRLKTLKLKDGYKDNQTKGFKRTHYPELYDLGEFEGRVKTPHVTLDLYPRVEALATNGPGQPNGPTEVRNEGKLSKNAIGAFDWDDVFLAVQEYKLLRTWSNLRLDRQRLREFCTSRQDWYTLYAPANELAVHSYQDVQNQQNILTRLLIDYTDRFYQAFKGAYEGQFFDVDYIEEGHASLLEAYKFEIDGTDEGEIWRTRLEELRQIVGSGELAAAAATNIDGGPMVAISFAQHLYYPLMSPVDGHTLPFTMRPIAFDAPGEVQFVRDLESFCQSEVGKETLDGKSLYLLRNAASKGKGLGFATAGNFYPDFLLWVVDEVTGNQSLSFVDPKGIRNLDLSNPKFALHSEIKKIEAEIGANSPKLSAFILSGTEFDNLLNIDGKLDQSDLEELNVLFMDDGPESYLPKLLSGIGLP